MPHRPALRAERTMPRLMRAARFFWKMPRYTTSHVKCAIAPPRDGRRRHALPVGPLVRPDYLPVPPGLSMANYLRKNRWIRLTGSLLDHVREVPMHGRIVGQLGMKRGDENAALAGHHAFPAVDDEGGDGLPHSPDAGGPDEDHLERLEARAEVGLPFRLEALLLPAIGIALGGDVDETQ